MARRPDDIIEEDYPALHQLLVELSSNADAYATDRKARTIDEYLAVNDAAGIARTIHELDVVIKTPPISTDDLEKLAMYRLDSDADARAFLTELRDALRDGLAGKSPAR